MNKESNSKQTYKITLICQLAPQSISPRGGLKAIVKRMFPASQRLWQPTPQGSVGLLVTRMEVEEVNPSPNVTMKQQSKTKEQSSKSTTCATSPGTVGRAEFKFPQCLKCGLYPDQTCSQARCYRKLNDD